MSVKICALQLGTLPLSDSRLDYYLDLAHKEGAKIVLLGEYVINSFFTELLTMPKSMIKEQSEQKKKALCEFSAKYDLNIIAPIVLEKGGKLFKQMAHFSAAKVKLRSAAALMPYSHWNESKFFSNEPKLDIGAFSVDGIKFATLFGFEAHFDEFWALCREKKIDCVLLPTACALDSNARWDALLSTLAFTNNIAILRANRIGKAKFKENKKEIESEFYGRTMFIDAHGQITQNLDQKEGMLLSEISKEALKDAKKTWEFDKIRSEFIL